MKKILSIALAGVLALSLLAACGGKSNDSSGSGNLDQSSASVSTPDQSEADGSEQETETPDASQPEEGSSSVEDQETAGAHKLSLNRTDVTLKSAGASFRLKYTCEPELDAVASFTSSDPAVATVDEAGQVTAVAPGQAVITLHYGDLTATCIVRCNWEEKAPETSVPAGSTGNTDSADSAAAGSAQVDLAAFYNSVSGKYEFSPFMQLADQEVQDVFYPGLSDIDTEQCLVYAVMMSNNMGEFALVQVKDSKDVDAVKAILQSRIDNMVDGGAWYPEATEQWATNAKVVSNGNYVMMVVNPSYTQIIKEFNALF